jgi:hypothetical protein
MSRGFFCGARDIPYSGFGLDAGSEVGCQMVPTACRQQSLRGALVRDRDYGPGGNVRAMKKQSQIRGDIPKTRF